jgi:hypothetical protein
MDYINYAARVDNIEDRIIEAKRTLIFSIAVIFLRIGKKLNLNIEKITTNLVRQFITTTIKEIMVPIKTKVNLPSVYP